MRLVAYAPAIAIIIGVFLIETGQIGVSSSTSSWFPLGEVSAILASVLLGTLWFGWRQAGIASRAMTVLNAAEDERRTISAIGIGANWDLDLNRIFARFSNDLTTLIDYDRITITTARPDGRMQLEFVTGLQAPEDEIGKIIDSVIGSPDGLVNPRDYDLNSQMTVPISVIDGTITIRSRQRDAYGPYHVDVMRQVVAQISPGISNAVHYQESQHRVMERTALAEIGRAATQEIDSDSILMTVSGALSNLIKLDHMGAIFTEADSDQATVVCWSTQGLLGLNVGDTIQLKSENTMSGVLSGRGVNPLGLGPETDESSGDERLWMQVPLGEQPNLLGVLIVSAPIDAVLGEDEADLLERVANQITPAIKNARLTADLTKAVEERRAIAAIGRAASTEYELQRIFAVVAEQLANIVPSDRFVATFVEPETGSIDVAHVKGIPSVGAEVGDQQTGLTTDQTRELRSRHAILQNNVDDFVANSPSGEKVRMRSWIQVALGELTNPMGFLSLRSIKPDTYDNSHIDFLESISRQITPTLKNAQMFEQERKLRDQLDTQNRELQEANDAKNRFLSTVSHELKTPLTIVSGFIDLLAADADEFKPDQIESLEIMRKNSTRLGLLINDVLDISRMDAGKLRIEPSVFLVNDLVGELVKSFEQLLETKDQTLEATISDTPIWIEADRNRIAQLITNLLSNAHKYSPVDSTIRLSIADDHEQLTVLVEDEGIGISEEDQKQLFTAFFRADNQAAREAGGTGLGLLIAKSIAELHDGNLWLNSIENQGTTVGFKLPGITSEPVADANADAELNMLALRSRLYPDTDWDDIGESA